MRQDNVNGTNVCETLPGIRRFYSLLGFTFPRVADTLHLPILQVSASFGIAHLSSRVQLFLKCPS